MSKSANLGPKCWTDGTFEIGDAPNPVGVLQEHCKTVLTLATAFLGVSAAFAEKLIGDNPSPWQIVLTAAVWVLLLVSILAAVLCNASMHSYLSWDEDWEKAQNRSALWGNLAPWPLLLAAGIVAGLATYEAGSGKRGDIGKAVATCQVFLDKTPSLSTQQWTIVSVEVDKVARELRVSYTNQQQKAAVFTVSGASGKIERFQSR